MLAAGKERRISSQYAIRRPCTVLPEVIRSREGPFKCAPCGKEFKLIYNFVSHMRFVHEQEAEGLTTADPSRKLNDVREKDGSSSSGSVQTALKHSKWYACDVCSRCFPSLQAVNSHERSHVKRNLTCKLCGRSFAQVINLSRHIYLCHSEFAKPRPFQCKSCGENFVRKETLNRHRNKNGCSTSVSKSNLTSSKNDNLEDHLQPIHGQERSPQTQAAVDVQGLVKSYKTEDNKSCRVCRKRFASLHSLDRHVRIIHLNERKFPCSVCARLFGEKHHLERHMMTHCSTNLECQV